MPGFLTASRSLFALLLGLLLLYCSVQRATSQAVDYCSDLPGNSQLEGLIAETFVRSDAPSTPDITVLEVNYVCLASGRLRGTFRGFSAVVRYECTDIRCPQSNVSQFEFGCTDGLWVADVLGSSDNLRTDVADATLTSPNRTDCSFCFGPSHSTLGNEPQLLPSYDNFNHCLACDPACNEGDMRCFAFSSSSCCNFYDPRNNFRCLNQCPANTEPNENFECTGVLRFSQAEYVYSEDSGVGFVIVEGTPGLRVRVIGGPDLTMANVRQSGANINVTVTPPANVTFNITNDNVAFEVDEVYPVVIIPDDPTVTIERESANIIIRDDMDTIQVGFESSNLVLVEGNTTGVRVRVNGETIRDISLFVLQVGIGQKLLEIEAGLYSEASVLSPEVINPDDQIALQDDRTFQLVLVPLPQFQSGIELGDVIGSDPTFSSSNITVVDNDIVTVNFDQTSYTVMESESLVITLSLDHGIAREFFVGIRAVPTTTTPPPLLVPSIPPDIYPANFTVSDLPQTRSITLTPADDEVPNEPNEVTRLVIFFVSDGSVEEGPAAELVIVDDDELERGIGFSASSYTFNENDGVGRVEVDGPSNFPATLSIRISGGPGRQPGAVITSGSDVNQQINSFPASISFPITDDSAALEPVERYTLSLTPSDPALPLSQAMATISIIDDDVIVVGFPYNQKTFPSSAVGNATLRVFGQAQQRFTVNFIQEFGVTTPFDFEAGNYSADFAMQLPIMVPGGMEGGSMFRVALVSPTDGVQVGGSVSTGGSDSPDLELFAEANITIVDDRIVVGFLAQEYTFSELGPSVPSVRIGKSGDLDFPFTVEVTATPDTPSPFIEPSAVPAELAGTVTFPADPLLPDEVLYALDIGNDQVGLEDDESVTLSLSSPSSSRVIVGGTVAGTVYYPTARVTVQDDDIVTLGIDGATTRPLLEGNSTNVCVSKDLVTVRGVNFLLTPTPGSAQAADYNPTTGQRGQLPGSFSSGSLICRSFSAVDDSLSDDGESFSVLLSSTDSFPAGPGGLQIGADQVDITITDPTTPPPPTPPPTPPGVEVEDTVIGDPLFTVPLPGSGHLCYEIRGAADKYFNFISDECVSVNAHYSERSPLPGETRRLHVVDQIAVRTVDNAGNCINILVDRNGCSTSVNSETITAAYDADGVTVRPAAGNTVVVGVPNCGDFDLEMEVVCETRNGVEMIRFEVMRGLNLRETSHGLLGQFWNVSISTEEFTGELRRPELTENLVLVTLVSPSSVRKFPAWQGTKTWDNRRTCLFGGNQNGGKVYEVADDQDSLIEGVYTDYKTALPFSTQFKFSQFDNSRCS